MIQTVQLCFPTMLSYFIVNSCTRWTLINMLSASCWRWGGAVLVTYVHEIESLDCPEIPPWHFHHHARILLWICVPLWPSNLPESSCFVSSVLIAVSHTWNGIVAGGFFKILYTISSLGNSWICLKVSTDLNWVTWGLPFCPMIFSTPGVVLLFLDSLWSVGHSWRFFKVPGFPYVWTMDLVLWIPKCRQLETCPWLWFFSFWIGLDSSFTRCTFRHDHFFWVIISAVKVGHLFSNQAKGNTPSVFPSCFSQSRMNQNLGCS